MSFKKKLYMCVGFSLYNCIIMILFRPMKRKQFTTTLREDYLKKIKILAVENDKAANDLLEEAIELLLKKYEKRAK